MRFKYATTVTVSSEATGFEGTGSAGGHHCPFQVWKFGAWPKFCKMLKFKLETHLCTLSDPTIS